jgi:sterol desaturase/sphingolipid hydroxylase (fatty acid hydroxylase superfamily)
MEKIDMSNVPFLAAALLSLFVGVAHSWLGEIKLIGPLLAPERRQAPLSGNFMRSVLRYAWHLTSVAWVGMGLALAVLTLTPLDQPGRMVAAVIGATFLITGLAVLIISRGRHLAWLVFLAIAGLCFAPLV